MILDINDVYNKLNKKLREDISKLEIKPCLSLIRVGNQEGSISFEKSLQKEAGKVGIDVKRKIFPAKTSKEVLEAYLDQENGDSQVNGILIFIPMDVDFDQDEILAKISPDKDVDGLSQKNIANLYLGKDYRNQPSTALASLVFLKDLTSLESKDILIINRSLIVGRPLALMLTDQDATVTLAHSETKDLDKKMKEADIIISAVGKAKVFEDYELNDKGIVIDIGLSKDNGRFYGDFSKERFINSSIRYLAPIGGIGKLNATIILRNTYENEVRNDR